MQKNLIIMTILLLYTGKCAVSIDSTSRTMEKQKATTESEQGEYNSNYENSQVHSVNTCSSLINNNMILDILFSGLYYWHLLYCYHFWESPGHLVYLTSINTQPPLHGSSLFLIHFR